ncbi:unnamed protein product [Albugo candida]|uniref:Secreted protein n=1 Tax=Albugo candida TaxID=65357 RepID=A0A024GE93_9STRA|nr:unnamed protein product [Albugo candida]|eukprot:CCI45197.1 unnamed protein product [Albugo candida]
MERSQFVLLHSFVLIPLKQACWSRIASLPRHECIASSCCCFLIELHCSWILIRLEMTRGLVRTSSCSSSCGSYSLASILLRVAKFLPFPSCYSRAFSHYFVANENGCEISKNATLCCLSIRRYFFASCMAPSHGHVHFLIHIYQAIMTSGSKSSGHLQKSFLLLLLEAYLPWKEALHP